MRFAMAGFKGGASAPHHLAAESGRAVLAEGGSAVEAMVAMAATIAVAYPHMNSIGGDGFWLVRRPGRPVEAIMACGRAAAAATVAAYRADGDAAMPTRGARAALTQPAAVSGWSQALAIAGEIANEKGRSTLPLSRLLADAVACARDGVSVTRAQAETTELKLSELAGVPGFAPVFLPGGAAPKPLDRLVQPALAATLERMAEAGLEDFYRGDIGAAHDRFLRSVGSPLTGADLAATRAERTAPLSVELGVGRVYNTPAPTQGVASLMILALFDRLGIRDWEGFGHLHGLVEATKQAFILRDAGLADPDAMTEPAAAWLTPARLDALAAKIDRERALPWPHKGDPGDTIWMGAADAEGCVVSYIQSIYWEFGSGLVCPETGVLFQNRGAGFSLDPGPNQLAPGKRPRHTLNPALAELKDGRVLSYGAMGGDGQPQFQAALFSRHVWAGQELQQAVTAPRWLLGRTWGAATDSLKIESRVDGAVFQALREAGHDVEKLPEFTDAVGHAGAVSLHPSGAIEAAADPRSDGTAVAL